MAAMAGSRSRIPFFGPLVVQSSSTLDDEAEGVSRVGETGVVMVAPGAG
jgi:hypothetical protein